MRYSPTDIEVQGKRDNELSWTITAYFTINIEHEVRIRFFFGVFTLYVDGREIMSTGTKMMKAQEFHYYIEGVDFHLTIAGGLVGALPTLVVAGVTIFSPYEGINWPSF